MKRGFLLFFVLLAFSVSAQEFKVEFDKDADFSGYKSFKFGEGAIITPVDQRTVPDATLHKWVKDAIAKELKTKGLVLDTVADITVSYMAGSQARTDAGNVGPLGLTPGGSSNQNYLRDYQQASLVIDLNDTRQNKLFWRVIASTDSNMGDTERFIDRVVGQGFKKFSIHPKKQKGKKKK